MYLSEKIHNTFDSNLDKFVGEFTYTAIRRRLGIIFNFPADLKFKIEKYDDFEEDEYNLSGVYDFNKDRKYIVLNVSSKKNTLRLDHQDYDQWTFLLSQVIQHETIHQLQYQHRDCHDIAKLDFRDLRGSLNEEREYLADKDEIDAYGHDIAMEIKYHYPGKDPYNILKNISKVRKLPSYNYYKQTFKTTKWSMVKTRLLKKTYNWIKYV